MKKFIFICGPNGVGKSTVSHRLNERISHSARVDSDWCRAINPFEFSQELMAVNEKNITSLLSNYLSCDFIEYIIFTYGFHGHRKQIFERVMENISSFEYEFLPVILTCNVNENIRRMKQDGRSEDRIQRAIVNTRQIYDDLPYVRIDTTNLNVDEVADKIIKTVL